MDDTAGTRRSGRGSPSKAVATAMRALRVHVRVRGEMHDRAVPRRLARDLQRAVRTGPRARARRVVAAERAHFVARAVEPAAAVVRRARDRDERATASPSRRAQREIAEQLADGTIDSSRSSMTARSLPGTINAPMG